MVWDTKKEMKTIDKVVNDIVKEEIKKIEQPKVLIKQKAHDKSKLLCEEYPNLEWMAGIVGTVEQKDNSKYFVVKDLVVIEQEVTGSSVKATSVGNKQLSEIKGLIGWIHSHNSMKSFQSTTDVDTAYNYQLTITTNNKSDYTGQCILNVNIIDNEKEVIVPVEFYVEKTKEYDDFITDAKEMISEEKPKTKPKTMYSKFNKLEDYVKDNEEEIELEYCEICMNKVSEKKEVRCELCGNVMHKKCHNKKYDNTKDGYVCPSCREDGFIYNGGNSQPKIMDDYMGYL